MVQDLLTSEDIIIRALKAMSESSEITEEQHAQFEICVPHTVKRELL